MTELPALPSSYAPKRLSILLLALLLPSSIQAQAAPSCADTQVVDEDVLSLMQMSRGDMHSANEVNTNKDEVHIGNEDAKQCPHCPPKKPTDVIKKLEQKKEKEIIKQVGDNRMKPIVKSTNTVKSTNIIGNRDDEPFPPVAWPDNPRETPTERAAIEAQTAGHTNIRTPVERSAMATETADMTPASKAKEPAVRATVGTDPAIPAAHAATIGQVDPSTAHARSTVTTGAEVYTNAVKTRNTRSKVKADLASAVAVNEKVRAANVDSDDCDGCAIKGPSKAAMTATVQDKSAEANPLRQISRKPTAMTSGDPVVKEHAASKSATPIDSDDGEDNLSGDLSGEADSNVGVQADAVQAHVESDKDDANKSNASRPVPEIIEPTMPKGYGSHHSPPAFPVGVKCIALAAFCCCCFFTTMFTQHIWKRWLPEE